MIVQSIRLFHFRNYTDISFKFHPNITIIIGPNSKGKTNLLEAVYVALNTTGFREAKEDELLMWHEKSGYVETIQNKDKDTFTFQVSLRKTDLGIIKKMSIQKTQASAHEYLQTQTRCVLFAPQHIDIITSSPDIRRIYIDNCIAHYYPKIKANVRNYEHALRRRNKVLEHHHNQNSLIEELSFWNTYLEEQGKEITRMRQQYCQFLNKNPTLDGKTYEIEYVKNEFTPERCTHYFEQEKRMRKTYIGPQKDDFIIYQTNEEKQNLHIFGSRSEQRLGAFWLKHQEINYIQTYQNTNPILLLDDIFSELDGKNKSLVLRLIGTFQTILTTTEEEIPELTTAEKAVIRL